MINGNFTRFEKWKSSRQKEILEMKRQNLEKDAQIAKLKNESIRRELLFKKKEDLLSDYKKSKDIMKNLISLHSSSKIKGSQSNNPSGVSRKSKRLEPSALLSKKAQGDALSEEEVGDILENVFQSMEGYMKEELNIKKREEGLERTETDLEQVREKYTDAQLSLEKLLMEFEELSENDVLERESLQGKIDELQAEANECRNRVNNLEEMLTFEQTKIEDMIQGSKNHSVNRLEAMIFAEEKITGSPANMKMILKVLNSFNLLLCITNYINIPLSKNNSFIIPEGFLQQSAYP